MIKKITFFISILLLFIPDSSFAGQIRVARVASGDIIIAVVDHMEIIVRLVGIDAPEISTQKNEPGQPYGQKAAKYINGLVLKKTITIKEYGIDRHGQLLGVVFTNGTNINLEMVKAGLAEVYRGEQPRYFNVKLYRDAEAEAKNAGRGMWSLGDKYISPLDWRRTHQIPETGATDQP